MNSIKKLIYEINKTPVSSFNKAGVIIDNYIGRDWKNYEKLQNTNYNKQKIYANNFFEIYILTWGPGQYSRIFDHQINGCWVKILKGSLQESIYNLDMKPLLTRNLCPKNNALFMYNDSGYHMLENKTNTITTSLHVYSPSGSNSMSDIIQKSLDNRD